MGLRSEPEIAQPQQPSRASQTFSRFGQRFKQLVVKSDSQDPGTSLAGDPKPSQKARCSYLMFLPADPAVRTAVHTVEHVFMFCTLVLQILTDHDGGNGIPNIFKMASASFMAAACVSMIAAQMYYSCSRQSRTYWLVVVQSSSQASGESS